MKKYTNVPLNTMYYLVPHGTSAFQVFFIFFLMDFKMSGKNGAVIRT